MPGSPITGTPSHSASSVGLPGLIASPWHQMPGGPSAATAAAVSSRPPTEEPAETTTTSASASVPASAASSAARSSATIPRGTASPPASRMSAASATAAWRRAPALSSAPAWPGPRPRRPSRGSRRADARGPRARSRPRRPAARDPGARSGRPADTSSVPRRASSSARTTPSPGATGRRISTVPAIARCVCSTITTASAPAGMTAPVGIATAPPGTTSTAAGCAHRHLADELQVSRQALGRAVRVGRAHRVPVDGRAGEARQVVRREHGLAGDAPVRVGERDRFQRGPARRAEAGQRVGHRADGKELARGAHCRQWTRTSRLSASSRSASGRPSPSSPRPS